MLDVAELYSRVKTDCLERARSLVQPDGVPERVRFAFVLARTSAGAPLASGG